MKYRCLIIDDEQTARNILKKYIADVPNMELMGAFRNGLEALAYLQDNEVDLLFLDIEMPRLSGLDFARIMDNKVRIIFTTAHRDFALEGFELNAADYLLKPFSFERFLKAVHKLTATAPVHSAENTSARYIYVKADRKMVRIKFNELLYIEGMSNYIRMFTSSDNWIVYDKLSEMVGKLPAPQFLRVHKSYIVNMDQVKAYTTNFLEVGEERIPVSGTYRERAQEVLS